MSRNGSDDVADVACSTFIIRGRIARVILFNYHTIVGLGQEIVSPHYPLHGLSPATFFSGVVTPGYLLITRNDGYFCSSPIKTAYLLDVTE